MSKFPGGRAEGRNREQEGGCKDQEAALINNDLTGLFTTPDTTEERASLVAGNESVPIEVQSQCSKFTRLLKNSLGVLRRAQDERGSFDIIEIFRSC
jgi:hypothetical protein